MWETLDAASLTPVRHYGLKSGLLQEGDPADFIVVDNLEDFNILSTYVQGREVYTASGGIQEGAFATGGSSAVATPNRFFASAVTPQMMKVAWQDGEMKVMVATEGSLLTGVELMRPAKDKDGNVVTDVEAGVSKIVVYNRYTESVPQVAYIKGFSLKSGAMASTIAHDSHNIVAVGSNDEDLSAAINTLIKEKGGIAVCDGERSAVLPLPVAGLMTVLGPDEVARKHKDLKSMARNIGCGFNAPFMTLAFMALPVIPELKITDKGLFDGNEFNFTSIWNK